MDFTIKKPYAGNEKPILQHVDGNVLTEWRVDRERDRIVREKRPVDGYVGPRAGTFFIGGMETTRDELAEYLLEASERNRSPRPDRTPEIQRKIERARERHAAAIREAVRMKQAGYTLPQKRIEKPKRYLLVPKAVGMEVNGEMVLVRTR